MLISRNKDSCIVQESKSTWFVYYPDSGPHIFEDKEEALALARTMPVGYFYQKRNIERIAAISVMCSRTHSD